VISSAYDSLYATVVAVLHLCVYSLQATAILRQITSAWIPLPRSPFSNQFPWHDALRHAHDVIHIIKQQPHTFVAWQM